MKKGKKQGKEEFWYAIQIWKKENNIYETIRILDRY